MVLGGHHCARETRTSYVNNFGGIFYEVMQDYQGDGPGSFCTDGIHLQATANTRYFTFKPNDNEIEAFTYSPALGIFEEDDSSHFILPYQMK